MSKHDYTGEQALALLMRKLKEADESLAKQIQAAIDAGKDIQEAEPKPRERKSVRKHRKMVAFSHQEALQIVLDALQSHFIEQPLFLNSVADNFAETALGVPDERKSGFGLNPAYDGPVMHTGITEEKRVEIELQTETQIMKSDGDETFPIKRVSESLIDRQQRNLAALRRLTDFA